MKTAEPYAAAKTRALAAVRGADPGAYFTIQSSPDLVAWTDQGSVFSDNFSNTVLVTANVGDDKRFWRMRRGQ